MSDQRIPISQLSETQTAPDASYIAIDDGSLTKKITVENFNSTSTASAQQYANQAAASAQTVEDNIATSAAQIREATLAAREATQASTAASASATSAYDSASLAQNYSANASTSAGQAMNAADSAAQNLTASKRYAEDSEAWAVGKRNGSDVPASDETYQNNAKYYANSASGSATRAETAAQSINAPDTTLTVSGVAADSKATGDRISSVNAELVDIRVMANGTTAATAGDAVREQVTELKSAFDVFSENVETELLKKTKTEITKTSQTDGTYIRWNSGVWQTLDNNANFHLMTYQAKGSTEYHLVNGSIYKPNVPAVLFYHDDVVLGSSEVPTESTWRGQKVASLEFTTPSLCNKIVTNNFGNPMSWTPALYEVSYTNDEILKWRGWLSSSDDAFYLVPGVYGIPQDSSNHPANLPADMTIMGYLVVFSCDYNNGNRVGISMVIENYLKRVWIYSGYGYFEIPDTEDLATMANNVFADIIPAILDIAKNFYIAEDEIITTKTQYRYLDSTGVKEISSSFPNWYVIDNVSVDPLTFYCVTASAQYNGHYLYQILDSNNNIISSKVCTDSSVLSITDELIFTPANASKIRIASVNGSSYLSLNSAEYNPTISRKWVGLKWACMGDSLTAVNSRTTLHYHDYIAQKTGITVVNLGAGGTGYKKEYNGVSGFVDRADTIPLDSDVVTVFGSGNDNSYTIGDPSDTGTETLCGCINTTIERIFDRMPTCNLGIITPTPWQPYNPANNSNWMAQYSEAIVEICRRWGVPCLDLYHCSNLRPWEEEFREAAYSKDEGGGVHPDETGHKLFAPRIEAFLDALLLH